MGAFDFTSQVKGDTWYIDKYRNSVISDLWMNVAVITVTIKERYTKQIWCDRWQSSRWANAKDIETHYSRDVTKMTPQAVTFIKEYVADRTEQDKPPPLPEPPPVEEPYIPDPIDTGGGIIDDMVQNLKQWIREAILAGLAFLERPLQYIAGILGEVKSLVGNLVNTMKGIVDTIMAKVIGMFETVVDRIKNLIGEVWNNIQKIWETMKDLFKTVKTAIVSALEKSWIFIKETFTELWGWIKSGLITIGTSIVNGIKFLWEKIKDGLAWAGKVLNSAYNALKDVMVAIWDRTKEIFHKVIETIAAGFQDAIEWLVAAFKEWMEFRDNNTRKLEEWSEERIVEFMTWVLKAQKTVITKLSREGLRP